MTKTCFHLFTISDYVEEENWLREQHNAGWKLIKITLPGFFLFESCTPEDVIYRLDFRNGKQTSDLMQMCKDFGWEYFASCAGWLYFRKSASEAETKEDMELFSDTESKLEMISHIMRYRMLPLMVIFCICIVPNVSEFFKGSLIGTLDYIFGVIYLVFFVLYLYIFIHCGRKLQKLKKQFKTK